MIPTIDIPIQMSISQMPTIDIPIQQMNIPQIPTMPVYSLKTSQKYDEELRTKVIEALKSNPEMIQNLIDLAMFEKTKHSIHDKNRPCYHGNRYDQCDDCYSGDTECDHNEEMQVFCKKLCKMLPSMDKPDLESDGEEDEDEDEGNERSDD